MYSSLMRALILLLCLGPLSAWAEKPSLVVLGDSLSAAYNINPELAWPKLLQVRLPNYQLVNRSISGATTAQGLALLPESLKQHTPAIVLLELGPTTVCKANP